MEINAKTSKLDETSTPDEMVTLIHHMFEQSLWETTHSNYSRRVPTKRHWLKSKRKPYDVGAHEGGDSNENVIRFVIRKVKVS